MILEVLGRNETYYEVDTFQLHGAPGERPSFSCRGEEFSRRVPWGARWKLMTHAGTTVRVGSAPAEPEPVK